MTAAPCQQLSLFSDETLPLQAYQDAKKKSSYGPSLPESDEIHRTKYRLEGETFEEAMTRVAGSLADTGKHFKEFREILLDMRFLPGGRIQAAVGNPRKVTAFSCFVIDKIEDSFCGKNGIMDRAKEAAQTMRMGGGVGYNFGSLRPRGDIIKKLQSKSSGPISFMEIYDAVCRAVMSAGHRRGAQMGVLPITHPDIEEFIRAKQNTNRLTGFNISVAVTDKFMEHLASGKPFPLTFKGRTHKEVDPNMLWEELMRSTWDWAEPGVLFIDTINNWNNLWYKETIYTTNPCSELPLPGNACCLLGSFNLVKYVRKQLDNTFDFDWDTFIKDIPIVTRAMDNVTERTIYPLEEQEDQQKSKRRMGIGVTGLANTIEALGFPYASIGFLGFQEQIFRTLTYNCYLASSRLAKEKGSFPLYDEEKYLAGKFIKTLPDYVRDEIKKNGIRNSHLTSIAPTGTISFTADNVSSGIEPVFSYEIDRIVQEFDGPKQVTIQDYGYRVFGVKGRKANDCSADDHLNVLLKSQAYIDSSVSKTCNVSSDMPWDQFKNLYRKAWEGGAKGLSTYTNGGKRQGILKESSNNNNELNGGLDTPELACYVDPSTGVKSCS